MAFNFKTLIVPFLVQYFHHNMFVVIGWEDYVIRRFLVMMIVLLYQITINILKFFQTVYLTLSFSHSHSHSHSPCRCRCRFYCYCLSHIRSCSHGHKCSQSHSLAIAIAIAVAVAMAVAVAKAMAIALAVVWNLTSLGLLFSESLAIIAKSLLNEIPAKFHSLRTHRESHHVFGTVLYGAIQTQSRNPTH
jgi:hypothetical protein